MTAIVGKNCDVALFHPSVDGGQPVGLICEARGKYGPQVSVHWEAYSEWDNRISDVRHLWFTALISDDLVNPDGSKHAEPAESAYLKLVEIITRHTGIGMINRLGVITGLKSSGYVMIQNIYPGLQTVEVHLTTRLTNFAPVDPVRYVQSVWVNSDSYHLGVMHWGNSYWRS